VSRFLVVFDVDSTLIEDEVIELLAEAAGKRDEVKAITDAAMAGDLDFSQSLSARVAMLAGVPEDALARAFSRVRITAGARELIAAIHRAGGKAAAVSGGFSQVLEPLAKVLELDFHRANTLEIVDGKLTGRTIGPVIDRSAKAAALAEWARELGLAAVSTIAVGDGANDLEMMAAAGIGVAFNAKPLVRASADLVLEGESLEPLIAILPR
jgi:phosphoserine phosphatase